MSWQAYWPNDTTAKALSPKDLFDCDGTKSINALVIDESATWCGPCNEEGDAVGQNMAKGGKWDGLGVAFVTLIGSGNGDPTIMDAQNWRMQHKQQTCYDGVDPMATFANGEGGSWPGIYIIDPRTMKITSATAGAPDTFDDMVIALAKMNKK